MPQDTPAQTFPMRWPWWSVLLFAAVGGTMLALIYFVDPEKSTAFLPCPFHKFTGLLCPGCGTQRALHDLLHGRIGDAFHHNAAMVLVIPLLGLQWGLPRYFRSIVRPEHDNRIVAIWLFLIIGWGVMRNLVAIPHLH